LQLQLNPGRFHTTDVNAHPQFRNTQLKLAKASTDELKMAKLVIPHLPIFDGIEVANFRWLFE
jgi:hypothetical protein